MGLEGGRRQAAVVFIAITVVIDVLGFGVIIPVLPRLVQQFMGGDPSRGAALLLALLLPQRVHAAVEVAS
jgi:hypothetical protein